MKEAVTLHSEDNVISLRTALVMDDGNIADFRLMPKCLDSSIPGVRDEKAVDWASRDYAWIYRHKRSVDAETDLLEGFPCIEQGIRPMVFERAPSFKLLWTDSGESVALYLDEEPWAFIDEKTRQGYSKGMLKPMTAKPWDQALFERIFGIA